MSAFGDLFSGWRFRQVSTVAPAVEPRPPVVPAPPPFSFAGAEQFLFERGFQTGQTKSGALVLHGFRYVGEDHLADWHTSGRQEIEEVLRAYLESIERTDLWGASLIENFKSFLLAGAKQRPAIVR